MFKKLLPILLAFGLYFITDQLLDNRLIFAETVNQEGDGSTSAAPSLGLDQSYILAEEPDRATVYSGETLQVTLAISNTGTMTATNLVLTSAYDDRLIERISGVSDGGQNLGNEISWEIGELAAGASEELGFDLTLRHRLPPGTIALEIVSSVNADESGSSIIGLMAVPVAQPDLVIEKESGGVVSDLNGNGRADPGDTIRYEVGYTNAGNAPAHNSVVVDDYPETLFDSISNISSNGKDDGNRITWQIDQIAAAQKDKLAYDVTLRERFPTGVTSIENQASISSDETGAVIAQHSESISLPVLSLVKERELISDLNNNGQIDPGDKVRYRVSYANQGNSAATNVKIEDRYTSGLFGAISSISGGGADNGTTIVWDLGQIKAQDQNTLTYEATVRSNLEPGSYILESHATLLSAEQDDIMAESRVQFDAEPTATPEPTVTPLPTAAPLATPVSAPVSGPQTGLFADSPVWYPIILIGLLAVLGMGAFVYVAGIAKLGGEQAGDDSKLKRERLHVMREGIFLVFIISSILILAIGRGVESDGAISILSAIVGYVFGRSVG